MAFEPGVSGNPAGRPKGSVSLTSALKRTLKAQPERMQEVVDKTIQDAIEGDVAARKLIFDRVDGAVPQRVNVTQLTPDQLIALALADGIEGVGEEGDTPSDE